MDVIKKLNATPIEAIHDAFEDAFAEYEVRISMPIERLEEMMTTRSYKPECSLGFFSNDVLAGFVLVGFREIARRRICYDVATGVRQSFQKRGVGDRLLTALFEMLRSESVDAFLLEVLVNNHSAQKLYEKYGFKRTRRLCCFEIARASIADAEGAESEFDVDQIELDVTQVDECEFGSFAPSWQNSFASYKNAAELHSARTISRNGELLGYGIVHKLRGGILQIGLNPSVRTKNHLATILNLLAESTEAAKLTFLNVEAGSEMERLLLELGFSRTVDQFEMECRLSVADVYTG